MPCAYLTNAKGNFIEVGTKYDVERDSAGQTTGIKASPCLTVKQDITDIHGYELVGEKIAYTESLDFVLTLKCVNNLYSISLSKQTTTGGTT